MSDTVRYQLETLLPALGNGAFYRFQPTLERNMGLHDVKALPEMKEVARQPLLDFASEHVQPRRFPLCEGSIALNLYPFRFACGAERAGCRLGCTLRTPTL